MTRTPAGEFPDLTALDLPAVDGMMLLAAHVSRHGTLTEWMDPSILDEDDPEERDPELDLYNPDNPNQPPYTEEFLERFRAAQIARNRRITALVKGQLDNLRTGGEPLMERGFVVHGTMADPRWLDLSIDPNDREPGCYLGDPRIVNMGPVGLARFSTLRSWLSQGSYDDANGDGPRCAADLSVPTLVIGNTADNACTPSHTHRLYDAVGHHDKTLKEIKGATHYYSGRAQLPHLKEATDTITAWMGERSWTN